MNDQHSLLGYQALADILHRLGVAHVFGMVGGTNVPWLAHGEEFGAFRFVRTRHEETAVNAAAGYSRSTGSLGVCTVTRGPGLANAVGGLVAARASRHAVLLIVAGSSPPADPTQDIDQGALITALGLGFHHVKPGQDLEGILLNAVTAARRSGSPQVLSVAETVLNGSISLGPGQAEPSAPDRPDSAVVAAAVDLLAASHHPIVLAGQGAVLAGARRQLEELVDLIGARAANTLRAHRFFAGHPSDLGLCGGWSPPAVRRHLEKADVVLAMGASLNQHTTDRGSIFADAAIIHCDIDDCRRRPSSSRVVGVTGDAAQTARALIDEWRARDLPPRRSPMPGPEHHDIVDGLLAAEIGHDSQRGLDPRQLFRALDELLPPDRIIVTDWGQSLGSAAPWLLRANDANSWILGRSNGVIGLGLGLAIGAATAHPDRPVALFAGDGGFMLSLQSLDTIRLEDLDLTVVILNNEIYGSEVKYLDQVSLPHGVIAQDMPDVPMLAAAFGGQGVVVRTRHDLEQLTVPRRGLFLVDARLDRGADVRRLFT